MHSEEYIYKSNYETFKGYIAYDDKIKGKRPAVLVVHDWTGCDDFAKQKADYLAKLGYVGFAVDMYGDGKLGKDKDEKSKLIVPFMEDRSLVHDRLGAALSEVISHEKVDVKKIAAIGFCFGGLCALDLARSGANLKGVVSFHGLLKAPEDLVNEKIKAKILVLHGFNDPMVPVEQLLDFTDEMNQAKADWQLHAYSHTMHAFTNPNANDPDFGTVYNKLAEQRSLQAMENFLSEIFK